MQKLRLTALLLVFVMNTLQMHSQATFPANDVANPKEGSYAFINATIVKDAQTTLPVSYTHLTLPTNREV